MPPILQNDRSVRGYARPKGEGGRAVARARLDWERDGADWPNRAASRRVTSGSLTWHVQIMGTGPTVLLLHGTGASTHSWRDLLPLLSQDLEVVALDLPGHGFTDLPAAAGLGMTGMSLSIARLLSDLAVRPRFGLGHSAGASILARMQLDGLAGLERIVGLNGAFRPLFSAAGLVMPALARVVASVPFVPDILAWRAEGEGAVDRLLRGTGSLLDPRGIELYRRLFSSRQHVAAALGMMANWDLPALWRDLPRLQIPMDLIAATGDLTISAEQAFDVKQRAPAVSVHIVRGLGHLAHEERPQDIGALIRNLLELQATHERAP